MILGISGMLGSMSFRLLAAEPELEVYGTLRSDHARRSFHEALQQRILSGLDIADFDMLIAALHRVRPDVVLNCIGVVKQLASAKDPLVAIPINALLPHRLARLCGLIGARLIHVSTDCVFSGRAGNYRESDMPDADDLYGRSKLLGEVDYPNALTIRTSIIGRELSTRNGLVEWFLGQRGKVRGFTHAIFSGLTTDGLTRLLARHILPRPELHGLWHVSADPISKFDLLQVIKAAYLLDTEIEPDPTVTINRALDSTRFRQATGYVSPSWPEMIARMRDCEGTR
jgi:dTDP-4-dehydrorhamnose reductase